MTRVLNIPALRNLCLAMIILMQFGCSMQKPDFWAWFAANQHRFTTNDSSEQDLRDELSIELGRAHPDLVYEIAIRADEPNELVISGDGIKEMIPIVRALVDAAPTVDGWRITAFRPRLDDYMGFVVNYEGRTVDPNALWFAHTLEDGAFDLIVLHPDYSDADRNHIVSATYILLDTALGEYDVMTGIRYIDNQKLPDDPVREGLLPFSELRRVFDEFKANRL